MLDLGNRILLNDGISIIEDDKELSRKHCEITCRNDRFVIKDLGSTNGTYYNDYCIEPDTGYVITEQCVIRIGTTEIKLVIDSAGEKNVDSADYKTTLPKQESTLLNRSDLIASNDIKKSDYFKKISRPIKEESIFTHPEKGLCEK